MKLSEEQKKIIIQKLSEKGMSAACPMCGTKKFIIADGYFNNSLQADLKGGLVIGGPAIPTIPIICSQCGFVSQHAVGVLGLLPVEEKK